MSLKIVKAETKHADGIEKIHLKHFAQIGEKAGAVLTSLKRPEALSYVALDQKENVVGYILSANYGTQNFFEWFGVSEEKKGIAKALYNEYIREIKDLGMKESSLYSRNRYRSGICFYLNRGYDIKGMSQTNEGDLLLLMKKIL